MESTGRHVLVVEDDDALRTTLAERLQLEGGFAVETARSTAEAREKLAATDARFDTILLDIGLPDFTSDHFYLKTLSVNLQHLLQEVEPDFIFYQSGVDILDTDQLGRLKVTRDGCKQRDRIVLDAAKVNRIPIVVSMGGGYSKDFRDIIEAHANTYRLAQEIFF